MVQKKNLALLISGIASATASAAQITKVEYTGIRTEFAQGYADLFQQGHCQVCKQNCSGNGHPAGNCCEKGYCGRDRSNNNGGSNGGGTKKDSGGGNKGGGNNGGSGGSKGNGTKKDSDTKKVKI